MRATMKHVTTCAALFVVLFASARAWQGQGTQPAGGRGGGPAGPPATHADIEYAPAEPAASNGHKLDLYLPGAASGRAPVVLWTGGSAWMADTGKRTAPGVAAQLLPAGYAVAGVSIRSSSQVQFPGQLHDIKAAVRWLRANAAKYNLDPDRIGIMGDSSGGWTTAMAALTGDAPELEGTVGVTGVSSKVQAAVAFYPPTNFLAMDAWALNKCSAPGCHDDAGSPESRLVGCAIQTCQDKVQAANPVALRHCRRSAPDDSARRVGSTGAAQSGRAALHGAEQGVPRIGLHQPAEGRTRPLEWLPDRRRDPRSGDDAIDERGRMQRRQPHAVHTHVEDGDRFPRQAPARGGYSEVSRGYNCDRISQRSGNSGRPTVSRR